jgi:hypothetical protein
VADAKLLADAVLGALAALLFAHVGRLNARRQGVDQDARRAFRQFAAWWLGLAGYTLVGVLRSLLAGLGDLDIRTHVALEMAGYVPLLVALWGLLSYLVYIYAGTHRWQPFLKGYHVALCLGLWLLLARTRPVAVVARGWTTKLAYADPLQGAPLALLVLAILGPVLAAAIGYGGLYPRTKDPVARRRILLVSAALVLWFGLSAVASGLDARPDWWPLATRALGVISALLLLAAFREKEPRSTAP